MCEETLTRKKKNFQIQDETTNNLQKQKKRRRNENENEMKETKLEQIYFRAVPGSDVAARSYD